MKSEHKRNYESQLIIAYIVTNQYGFNKDTCFNFVNGENFSYHKQEQRVKAKAKQKEATVKKWKRKIVS